MEVVKAENHFVRDISVPDENLGRQIVQVEVFDNSLNQLFHPRNGKPLLSSNELKKLRDGSAQGVCFAATSPTIDINNVLKELETQFPNHINLVVSKPATFADRFLGFCSNGRLGNQLFGLLCGTTALLMSTSGIMGGNLIPAARDICVMGIAGGSSATLLFGTILGLRAFRVGQKLIKSVRFDG